jgi:hypothetical protein
VGDFTVAGHIEFFLSGWGWLRLRANKEDGQIRAWRRSRRFALPRGGVRAKVLLFVCTFTGHFGMEGEKRKTYGRFLGMIFFGGAQAAVTIGEEGLVTPEGAKTGKTTKKSAK